MSKILCLAVTSLILHTVHSYILMTANMEDVQSIVRLLATSPVVDQVKKIWHRAATQFNNELQKLRAQDDMDFDMEHLVMEHLDRIEEENRRKSMDALVSLSENASEYIHSFKRALDSFLA